MPKSRKTPSQIGLEYHLRPTRAERPRGSSLVVGPRTGATVQGCCRGRALTSSPQPPRLARTASPRCSCSHSGGKGWSKVSVPRPGDPVFVTQYSYLVCKNIICNTLQAIYLITTCNHEIHGRDTSATRYP